MNLSALRPLRSFRMLLYLEWLLLCLAILTSCLPAPPDLYSQPSERTLLSILAFGAIGLRLPTERFSHKVAYTAIEFSIILVSFVLDTQTRAVPFLVMIAVVRGCQMFALQGRMIITGLAFIVFLLVMLQQSDRIEPLLKNMSQVRLHQQPPPLESLISLLRLNVALSFGVALVAILLLVNSLLAERQSRRELATAHEQLRQYALRIENQATLQERNRIAREIHDTLGHALTAQSIQLENALLFCPSNADKTQTFLTEAQQLCSKALQDVRQSVATLRSSALEELSLETAIAFAAKEFYQMASIMPHYTMHVSSPVPPEVGTALCRIIQEALMNIYKHSEATQVAIHLQEEEEGILLWIEDDGNGFYPKQNMTGFGVQGMRERTTALGGEFNLVSEPGAGCLITAYIPLNWVTQ